jgi:hypothetical protein
MLCIARVPPRVRAVLKRYDYRRVPVVAFDPAAGPGVASVASSHPLRVKRTSSTDPGAGSASGDGPPAGVCACMRPWLRCVTTQALGYAPLRHCVQIDV